MQLPLTKDDFGNKNSDETITQNVAKIKFDTVPANGTIYAESIQVSWLTSC